MKTLLSLVIVSVVAATSYAQPGQAAPVAPQPTPDAAPALAPAPAPAPAPTVATASAAQPAPEAVEKEAFWSKPTGRRFMHGFRLGYTFLYNFDKSTRENDMSIKDEFGLKTPHMMLLGYEGFYRIVGHSWLNVLLVGNVTVAGLEQSKFIPAASGLIGFEFDQSFQLGVGVNVTPDPQSPTHMIAAAGWTPRVGSIHTPIHFFVVPDTESNHRVGATVGMTW